MGKTEEKLPVTQADAEFAIMQIDKDEMKQVLNENLGGEHLTAADLESVSVPPGGGTTWTLNTIDGEIETKEIYGIIIFTEVTRAYWPSDFSGGAEPPSCTSSNGIIGVGNPGGDCLSCGFNQYGSASEGTKRGKACGEKRFLFLVTADETLPIVIKVPATSLKASKRYLFGLTSKRQALHSVYTKLSLEKASNKDGIAYSQVIFTKVGNVESPEKTAAYAATIKPFLSDVARQVNLQRDSEDI